VVFRRGNWGWYWGSQAQFVVTGVLGPHSNAHGPNEFLHIPTGKRVTMAMAQIIADHFHRPKS